MILTKIIAYLAVIYVAISPIYWFFYTPLAIFSTFKYVLASLVFLPCILIGAKDMYHNKFFVNGSCLNLIFAMVVLSLPGVLISQDEKALFIFVRYLILIVILISFYWLIYKEQFLTLMPPAISLIIFLPCVATIMDWVLKLGIPSGGAFNNHLCSTGFSTSRTQWSSGLACMSGFMMWSYIFTKKPMRYFYLCTFTVIFFSQIVSGGRGGALSTFLGATFLLIYNKRYLLILSSFSSLFAFVIFFKDRLFTLFRFDRLSPNWNPYLDVTAGRLQQYEMAFDLINNNPMILLFGMGIKGYFNDSTQANAYYEIHNVWLRLLVEYGVLLPLFTFTYVLYSMYFFVKINRGDKQAISIVAVILASMFVTMVEPNAIFSNYQNYLCWWVLFIALKNNRTTQILRS